MYLARKIINGNLHYFIRETYREESHLLSRDLFDLGTDPARFIVYPGGRAYYIDQVVEDHLRSLGSAPDGDELEDIFLNFLKPEIKRLVEPFRGRQKNRRHVGTPMDTAEKAKRIHLFDKRRIHFLRYGQINQGFIGRVSPKLFQVLHHKSRDEIEQYFIDSEQILRPTELKTYVYVIFDLQKHFTEMISKMMPQGLNQNKVDAYFIEEVCRLDRDSSFWAGLETGDVLHEYLIRYIVMFFDSEYDRSPFLDEYIHNFMNSRRHQRTLRQRERVSLDEAATIFGVTKEALKKENRRGLTRLFRKKAQELHPDKGGDHDRFVKLTSAYQDILKRRPNE
ncbi:J domain-containing protein [Thermodesulfobacteriota bacterium]